MTRLLIKEIVNSDKFDDAAILVLVERSGTRELPITINKYIADKILSIVTQVESSRPDIYYLFNEFLQKIGYNVDYVVIDGFDCGIFHAKIHFSHLFDSTSIGLDARLSDAVLLALYCKSDIFCKPEVLDNASINQKRNIPETQIAFDGLNDIITSLDKKSSDIYTDNNGNVEKLSLLSIDELNLRIDIAISNEDYKLAAILRDARNKKL